MDRYSRNAASSLLIFIFALGVGAGVAEAQQSTAPNQSASVPSAPPVNTLPDSPGSVRFQIVASNQQDAAAVPQEATATKVPAEQQPVGTAAAESIQTSGVAASAPAGTAIAPAKQRQVRSLLIRMGAVLGAGAAVGTALALSEATPSKPPGAH